jgi:hypothetical protein
MGNAQFFGDLAQVTRNTGFVLHHDVRLITFKSAIFARCVRISSFTPSAKKRYQDHGLNFRKAKRRCSSGQL